jgi:hypothetical protein
MGLDQRGRYSEVMPCPSLCKALYKTLCRNYIAYHEILALPLIRDLVSGRERQKATRRNGDNIPDLDPLERTPRKPVLCVVLVFYDLPLS